MSNTWYPNQERPDIAAANRKIDLAKLSRVRVLRGFCRYQTEKDEAANDVSLLREHLPGAVIDLQEVFVLEELQIKRVERVDPSVPLSEGWQPITGGAEDARDAATLARAGVNLEEMVAKAVADALAKAKK